MGDIMRNDEKGKQRVAAQSAVAAVDDRRNQAIQKPAVIDPRYSKAKSTGKYPARVFIFILTVCLISIAFMGFEAFRASNITPSTVATYSHGLLHMTIP